MAQDLHAPPRVEFTLAGFLLGPSRACGLIEDRFRRVRRRFTVELHGAWIGELFLLDERFDYDDGRRETRQWTVRNAGRQRFTATAPDCVGVAHGRVSGGTIHMGYAFRLQLPRRPLVVDMDDRIHRIDARHAINRIVVSKWGVRIAEITLCFERP